MLSPLTTLFVVILVGYVLGEICKITRVPRVVGYLITGIMLGLPQVKSIVFTQEGLDLINLLANLGIILFFFFIGLGINFLHIDPIKALIYSAVANGLIAPVILFLIVSMSNNQKIMGKWANGMVTKILGWVVTIAMIIAGIATIISLFS